MGSRPWVCAHITFPQLLEHLRLSLAVEQVATQQWHSVEPTASAQLTLTLGAVRLFWLKAALYTDRTCSSRSKLCLLGIRMHNRSALYSLGACACTAALWRSLHCRRDISRFPPGSMCLETSSSWGPRHEHACVAGCLMAGADVYLHACIFVGLRSEQQLEVALPCSSLIHCIFRLYDSCACEIATGIENAFCRLVRLGISEVTGSTSDHSHTVSSGDG